MLVIPMKILNYFNFSSNLTTLQNNYSNIMEIHIILDLLFKTQITKAKMQFGQYFPRLKIKIYLN